MFVEASGEALPVIQVHTSKTSGKIDELSATFSPMIRKPIRRWNCETLRDLPGWKRQKAEGWNWLVEEFERQAGLVAPQGRGKIFSDGTVKGGIWSNWSGILFFAFVGPLVDEFYNRSSHDQDQVIKATLTVNYKKLMNPGFGFIKPWPFEGKWMDEKRVKVQNSLHPGLL